ncbi:hypothetical protein [Rhizobium giardinii]|uniref:Molybdenum cofactor cytidylyltransferase n=1 Tax=Rhizobium giardinii TaxID=56731 RepID=A0A7W8UG81_9HYPH|nr:molybdenum cofactor cytidylyltransferase [Rhizobium giardinii]
MKFGEFPVAAAEGLLLAHTVILPDRKLHNKHPVSPADIEALQSAGIVSVIGARIEGGDISGDEAARQPAAAMHPIICASPRLPLGG